MLTKIYENLFSKKKNPKFQFNHVLKISLFSTHDAFKIYLTYEIKTLQTFKNIFISNYKDIKVLMLEGTKPTLKFLTMEISTLY